jgi:hypothetical protein
MAANTPRGSGAAESKGQPPRSWCSTSKLVAATASRPSRLMSDVLEATVLRVQSWRSRPKARPVRLWRPALWHHSRPPPARSVALEPSSARHGRYMWT